MTGGMMKRCFRLLPLFFFTFTLCAEASIIDVPEDFDKIQDAINSAADGDTVSVAPGTYFERIDFSGKAILVGSYYALTMDTTFVSQTIIDADKQGRVVDFTSGEDQRAILSGFTITNGENLDPDHSTYGEMCGGGIVCIDSSPSLERLTITENYADGYGGGLYCKNASPSVSSCIINNNQGREGSGIYCNRSSCPVITGTIIDNCREIDVHDDGGAIVCLGRSCPVFENVTLIGGYDLGGIRCEDRSNPTLKNFTFIDVTDFCVSATDSNPVLENITAIGTRWGIHSGGSGMAFKFKNSSTVMRNSKILNTNGYAIYCDGASPTFENVLIDTVTGDPFISGIYLRNNSYPVISNCTIMNVHYTDKNQKFTDAGIQITEGSKPHIINTLITGNRNGILNYDSTLDMENCNIWGNHENNIVFSGMDFLAGNFTNYNGTSCDRFLNISEDPLFIADDDYHLSAESPCIDAGSTRISPEDDIEGTSRIGSPDIGAYEYLYDISVKDEAGNQPQAVTLRNAVPNPFNASTILSFNIPKEGYVNLGIYNLNGQKVMELVDGTLSAGNHTVLLDGLSLASGVYFAQLIAGGHTKSIKVTLLK